MNKTTKERIITLSNAITDAEWRIGSYVAGFDTDTISLDGYIVEQIAKIKAWQAELDKLARKGAAE